MPFSFLIKYLNYYYRTLQRQYVSLNNMRLFYTNLNYLPNIRDPLNQHHNPKKPRVFRKIVFFRNMSNKNFTSKFVKR